MRFKLNVAVALICSFTIPLASCANPPINPTPTALVEALSTSTSTSTPTANPTPSPTQPVQAIPTDIPASPTPTEIPFTPTPSVVEYVIQPDDTLIFIIRRYGYRDLNVLDDVVRLNPNMTSADRLPPPGSTILIPLPTLTPTLASDALTATRAAGVPVVQLPVETIITQHTVREGETIIGIAEQYRTTLRILSNLNPSIFFSGCNFANPSGGPDCRVFLEVGQSINVPAPTPTPTLSPTPSGSETPTPTPTRDAPLVSFPPRDAVIRASTFTLQWVSVGILEPQQVYLVQIENLTTGTLFNDVTRATSYQLPAALAPTGGTVQQYRWRVSVAQLNEAQVYALVGAEGQWRAFAWQTG